MLRPLLFKVFFLNISRSSHTSFNKCLLLRMTKNTASGSFRSYETLRTLSVNQFTDPTKSPLYTVTFPLYTVTFPLYTVTFPFTLHCHGVTFPFTIHCALSFPLTGTATFPFTVHCHFCLCSTLPVTFPFRVHCHLFF